MKRVFEWLPVTAGIVASPETMAAPKAHAASAGHAESSHDSPLPILALCAAAFLLAWLPRLHWGFWTDEGETFWMACMGWREAIARTAVWPAQSFLYAVLESFFVSQGFWKELLLRLPSVLAMGVAAWQLKRITERMFGRSAGWLALAPFLGAPQIVEFGTSARPYALALAASLASFRYLLDWQESADYKTTAKYLISSLLTLHFHYFFGFIFVVQGAYLLCCRACRRKVSPWLPLAAAILLPASLLPVLGVLRSSVTLVRVARNFVRPTIGQLLEECFPPAMLLAIGLGLVLLLISARNLRWRPTPLRPEFVFLLAAWIGAGPVAFFLASRLTAHCVFATRFQLFAFPGFILAVVWAIHGLERREWRFLVLLAIFAGTVLHPGNLLAGIRDSPASWREPLRMIAAQPDGRAPVFVTSGFVESGGLRWTEADPTTSWLFAPLTAYPIRNPLIPLPFQFDDHVPNFLRDRGLVNCQRNGHCFLLAPSDSRVGPWMAGYMRQHGFRAETHAVNNFVVIEFRRE
jgi:hypothetical protein